MFSLYKRKQQGFLFVELCVALALFIIFLSIVVFCQKSMVALQTKIKMRLRLGRVVVGKKNEKKWILFA